MKHPPILLGLAAICTCLRLPAAYATNWPFPADVAGVQAMEDDRYVGLYNARVGFLLDKKDVVLHGMWSSEGWSLLGRTRARGGLGPWLWQVQIMPTGADEAVTVLPDAAEHVGYRVSGDERSKTLAAAFTSVKSSGCSLDVGARFALGDGDRFVRARIAVELKQGGASVWSVTFPQLVAVAPDPPGQNKVLIPYRRGLAMPFGQGAVGARMQQPYPSSSAHFQFMAAYGEKSGQGLYLATEDGAGYGKTFHQRHFPGQNCVRLALEHTPENRAVAGTGYAMPYDIAIGPYRGDWWHACRIYRQWWLKQIWASKGLIHKRKDIPEWLKRASVVTRQSCSKPGRTVARNVAGATSLSSALGGRQFFGIWYAPFDSGGAAPGVGLARSGHGHILPPKADVTDALRGLRGKGIHLQAYIQSLLYQHDLGSEAAQKDLPAARAAVARDRKGTLGLYAHDKALYAMCRATGWWQTRVVELAKHAVKMGFAGVYLDSFGRGGAECFAQDHGHALGGGLTITQGQRKMAQRVLAAIRQIDPEAILSGEAPVESYRDILHVNLYALNTMNRYVPAFRTVWGDYSLGHGRTVRPSKANDNFVPELTTLFLEGTIFGRFFCSGGRHFFLEPEYAKEHEFLQELVAYAEHGMDYLRFGEYLHPAELSPAPKMISYTEGALNRKVDCAGVMNSVTRSYRDGSVAIVLVNVGGTDYRGAITIDPSLRSQACQQARPVPNLVRMDEAGKCRPIRSGRDAWDEPLALGPREIVFFVLR